MLVETSTHKLASCQCGRAILGHRDLFRANSIDYKHNSSAFHLPNCSSQINSDIEKKNGAVEAGGCVDVDHRMSGA